jgi:biopolymer transport protein ExbD
MAFAAFDHTDRSSRPLSEINMVPFIDVMLVLLVIFLVTAPLMTHSVPLQLPQAAANPTPDRPERVSLAIDASGQRHWNGEPVSPELLAARLAETAARAPATELQIAADAEVPYRHVALTLAEAARVGLVRIGFVSVPPTGARSP